MKNRIVQETTKAVIILFMNRSKKKNIVVFSVKSFFGCAIHKNDEKIYRKAKKS